MAPLWSLQGGVQRGEIEIPPLGFLGESERPFFGIKEWSFGKWFTGLPVSTTKRTPW